MSQGDIWTTCAQCSCRVKVKDVIYVTDRYSSQYGQVVCARHKLDVPATDKPLSPSIHEKPLSAGIIKKMRPQDLGKDSDEENLTRAPSAPTRLTAVADSDEGYVVLSWLAPQDMGSDPITGYVIKRSSPQYAHLFLLEDDTEIVSPYYIDTSSDLALKYSYSVAAINAFGTGAYSALAHYPTDLNNGVNLGLTAYLIDAETNYNFITGDGDYLVVTNES